MSYTINTSFSGACPGCKIHLTSNDHPFGRYCPYCKHDLPGNVKEVKE